tara:strand:- start:1292 stop:1528 length:237 start_codon:yes stop_codon:yes gene_type:complete
MAEKERYAKGAKPRKAESLEQTVEGLKQGVAGAAAVIGLGMAAAGYKTIRDRQKSNELRKGANKPFNKIKIRKPHNFE